MEEDGVAARGAEKNGVLMNHQLISRARLNKEAPVQTTFTYVGSV